MKLKIDEIRLPNDNTIDEFHFPNDNSIDELWTPDKMGGFDQLRTPDNGFGELDELRVEAGREAEKPKKAKKEKTVSYEQYFGEMGISRHQVAQRVALAKDLEDDFDYLFYCMNLFEEDNEIESKEQSYYEFFPSGGWKLEVGKEPENLIAENVKENSTGIPQDIRPLIIAQVEPRIERTLDKRMEYTPEMKTYVVTLLNYLMDSTEDLSHERSVRDAKTESNTIYNRKEYNEAVERGKLYKTWHTMRDEKVRQTHAICDNVTIPIAEAFPNGLLYPHDPDGSPEEVINCRCWLTFT